MKKSSTIHIEERFWNIIQEYQRINNIDSRNDAIQLILNEYEILKGMNFKLKEVKKEVKSEVNEVKKEKKEDKKLLNGLKSIKNTMKDE